MMDRYEIEITVTVVADCEEMARDRAREVIAEGRGRAEIVRVTPIVELGGDEDSW
jgi:hypothetical protein